MIEKNKQIIKFISANERNNIVYLIKEIRAILDYFKMSSAYSKKAINMLLLKDRSTARLSTVSQNAVDKAVKSIEGSIKTKITKADKLKAIQTAVAKGEKAVLADKKYTEYIKEISKAYGDKFFKDVYNEYLAKKSMLKINTKCGQAFLSVRYCSYYKKKVYGKDISDRATAGIMQDIKTALNAVSKEVGNDLRRNMDKGNERDIFYHIPDENIEQMKAFNEELKK